MLRSMIAAALAFATLAIAGQAATANASHSRFNEVSLCDNNARCVVKVSTGQGGHASFFHKASAARHGHTVKAARATGASPASLVSGVIRSRKTGTTAHVAPRYAAMFQAYIDDLEAGGAVVKFMGGYRRGVCSPRSEHPCGKALDVCQRRRGVVDPSCHLPGRAAIAVIAARHGLFEGGRWCNSDYGHAQVDVTAAPCGAHDLYSAVSGFKRQHRHARVARR